MSDDNGAGGKATFYTVDDLRQFSPVAGITMQAIVGEQMLANWVRLEPNTVMPEHDHPQEQLGVVLEGVLHLTVAGETKAVEPGMAYTIQGGVRHKGVAGPEGCLVLDIFAPPREDYARMARGEG
jgi:quercetin dioxygenase-like cupin family protein